MCSGKGNIKFQRENIIIVVFSALLILHFTLVTSSQICLQYMHLWMFMFYKVSKTIVYSDDFQVQIL